MTVSVLQEISIFEKVYNKFLKTEMKITSDNAKAIMIKNKHYSSRETLQSISGSVDTIDNFINTSFGANTKQAIFAELGRPAGEKPPIDNILSWLHEKVRLGHFIIKDMQKNKKGKLKLGKKEELTGLAFLICSKIGAKGTKPQPFLSPAWEAFQNRFNSAIPLPLED